MAELSASQQTLRYEAGGAPVYEMPTSSNITELPGRSEGREVG